MDECSEKGASSYPLDIGWQRERKRVSIECLGSCLEKGRYSYTLASGNGNLTGKNEWVTGGRLSARVATVFFVKGDFPDRVSPWLSHCFPSPLFISTPSFLSFRCATLSLHTFPNHNLHNWTLALLRQCREKEGAGSSPISFSSLFHPRSSLSVS